MSLQIAHTRLTALTQLVKKQPLDTSHGFAWRTLFDIWIFRDSSRKECCSPFRVVTDWDEF